MTSKNTSGVVLQFAFAMLVLAVCIGSSAVAALSTGNINTLPSPDGQNVTFDSLTNLEWLDPTVTTNQSVVEVTARFATDLAGFRYATREEVRVFLTHFPSPLPTAPNYSFQSVADGGAAYDGAAAYFGIADVQPGFVMTEGITGDDLDALYRYVYETGKRTNFNPAQSYTNGTSGFGKPYQSPGIGHWLVQEVPEPSTLMLAAPIALIFIRHRVGG